MPYQRIPSLTDKVKVASLTGLDSSRYAFLQLSNAEPNFGLPPLSTGSYALITNGAGERGFSSDISNFVLVSAADTKYFTVSGGDLLGPVNFVSDNTFAQSVSVLGNLTVFGQITALQNTLVVVNVVTSYPGNFIADGYLSAGALIYCRVTGTKSSDWGSTFASFKANSGNFVSTYTSLFTNSAKYETTHSNVRSNSARWESVYNTTRSNSGRWDAIYSVFNENSANYDSTYLTVSANSAFWAGGYEAYTTVNTYSAEWSNSSIIKANSGKWESTYGTTSALSGNWGGVYVYKNSNFNAERTGYYAVDTTSNIVRATLPTSPAVGDPITFSDPFYSWASNFLEIRNNGSLIEGTNDPLSANIAGYYFQLVYMGGAQGWRVL